MSWEESFKLTTAVLTSIGGGGILVWGLASYLGKLWATRIIEREKLELAKLRKEHEIRFSSLHVEMAEAIKEIARKLQELQDSMYSFLKDFQPIIEPDLEQKIQHFVKTHSEFVYLYKKNKIFFPKDIANLMDHIALSSRDTYIDVTTYPISIEDRDYQLMPKLLKERDDCWKKARERFDNDLTNLIARLESHFRHLLGIE
jgi:hypothetical protein